MHKPQINLNDYAEISVKGYDTVGIPEYTFDYEAFTKDWAKKLSRNKSIIDQSEYSADICGLLIDSYINGEFDKDDSLSNGDTVVYSWDCDDDGFYEATGYKLKYSDISTKVKDLKEAKTFDPFENISIEYSGMAPYGTARVVDNSSEQYSYYMNYAINKSESLSNGDKIVVSVSAYGSSDINTQCIEDFEAIPSTLDKEYTVEGLQSYVSSAAEIPDGTLETMKSQVEDKLTAYAANYWDDDVTLKNLEYVGNYLLTAKKSTGYYDGNRCIIVYKVTAHVSIPDKDYSKDYSYYYGLGYNDIIIEADGNCTVDYSNDYDNYVNLKFDTGIDNGWFSTYSYSFNGYKDIPSLYKEYVTTQAEYYECENNVAKKDDESSASSSNADSADYGASAGSSDASESEKSE